MRQLAPEVRELALEELHADLVLGRDPNVAHVALNMVSSLDGAVTIDGRSGGLGGEADGVAFRRLRDSADVILVGAGTVRAEAYGAIRPSNERRDARIRKGLRPAPTLAIVSGSLRLDPKAPIFASDERPLIFTHAAAPKSRRQELAAVAEIYVLGERAVDVEELRATLASRRLGRILCEGGPQLNGTLLAANAVDELFVTVAPLLVAGDAPRIVVGDDVVRHMRLVSVHEHENELLVRYARHDRDRSR